MLTIHRRRRRFLFRRRRSHFFILSYQRSSFNVQVVPEVEETVDIYLLRGTRNWVQQMKVCNER